MKQQAHTYKNIIIGGSLEALRFAYENDYPILCIPLKPHFFRPKCLAEWEHLAFLLSLSGQMPVASNINSIRIDEEQREVKCFTDNSRVISYKYEKIYLVDDHGVGGLPLPAQAAKKEYLVFDWINIRCGANHPYDYIIDEESNFVGKILFYRSERATSRRSDRKDACAVSLMTDSHLKNLDYSESYALLKTRDMMDRAGMKGARNGTQATTGKPAYLSLKIEIGHRETHILHKSKYKNTSTINFNDFLDKEGTNEYNKFLEEMLGNRDGRVIRGS